VAYLDATAAVGRDRSRHRVGRDTASPACRHAERGPRAVIGRARESKGLATRPLDGGALSLGRARAPARGPEATPPPPPPSRHGRLPLLLCHLLQSAAMGGHCVLGLFHAKLRAERDGEGEEKRKKGPVGILAAPPANRRRWPPRPSLGSPAATPPVAKREKGLGESDLGFQWRPTADVFDPPKSPLNRPM
jgi:hypothetical protein